MPQWPSFYGLQPRWITADRLYKVFLLDDSLCAARVAGQFGDERGARMQLVAPMGALGFAMLPLVRRLVRRREEREAFYDSVVPGSVEFLAADARNFVIHRSGVVRIQVCDRESHWTGGVPNAGSITIESIDGSRRRLILLGEPDVAEIRAQLGRCLGGTAPLGR